MPAEDTSNVRSPVADPDLPQLRELHVALLKRWDGHDAGGLVKEALELRETVKAAGVWIDAASERDNAQGIIDYWTSAVSSVPGQGFPALLQLDAFDRANRDRLMSHADATLDDLRATGLGNAARLVVLS